MNKPIDIFKHKETQELFSAHTHKEEDNREDKEERSATVVT